MKSERISTGIAGLDTLLKGGYIRGRTYVVSGDAGTGKTTFCLQFLARSLAAGEKAVYVTVDERPAEILESAAAYAWDLQPHIQAKNLVILDAAPYFEARGTGVSEQGINPQKMVTDLGTFAKSVGATILILDPLTPLTRPMDSKGQGGDHARSLIQLIKSNFNTTNIFTSHDSSLSGQEPATAVEQFLASGVLLLKTVESQGRFERTVTIKKMRHTPVEPGHHPFALVVQKGVVLLNGASLPADAAAPDPEQTAETAEPRFFVSFEPTKE